MQSSEQPDARDRSTSPLSEGLFFVPAFTFDNAALFDKPMLTIAPDSFPGPRERPGWLTPSSHRAPKENHFGSCGPWRGYCPRQEILQTLEQTQNCSLMDMQRILNTLEKLPPDNGEPPCPRARA